MARFEVDSAEVAQAAGAARSSGAIIHSEVGNMMRHLTNLQASWHGGASSAFSGLIAQWQATQRQVETSLESISTALDASARQYDEVEANNLRMFSQ